LFENGKSHARPNVGVDRRARNRSAACRADALVRPCRTTC
jgi:hypothetical protein